VLCYLICSRLDLTCFITVWLCRCFVSQAIFLLEMSVPVNRSGVVVNANGQRLFGMDAAHYQKMQSKEDPHWEKTVIAWLEALLGEKFESDDLWVLLKNGIVLIRVINTLKPGTITKYNKTRLVFFYFFCFFIFDFLIF
jgi:hypothetical protein